MGNDHRYCRQCGYSLYGLTESRCPECGKGFDPADPKTYRHAPKHGPLWLWLRRIGVALAAAFLLVSIAFLWLYRDWHQDNAFVRKFSARHDAHENGHEFVASIGPTWLHRALGKWNYLLDRGISFSDSEIPFTQDELDTIFRSPHLRDVSINGAYCVTDNTMKKMGKCRSLNFFMIDNAGGVTNEGMQAIAGLTALRWFQINNGQYISSLAAVRAMSQLAEITACDNSIDDDGIAVVGTLPNLKSLAINHSKLTDAGFVHIAKAKKLESLCCGGTPVTDAGLAQLTALPNLAYLYIPDAHLTPACLSSLKSLKHLYCVFLPANLNRQEFIDELFATFPKIQLHIVAD